MSPFQTIFLAFAFVLSTAFGTLQTWAEEGLNDSDLAFFENRVRPLLLKHCLECHGDDAEDIRGGLDLTSRPAIKRGGDSGPVIDAIDINESLLVRSVRYQELEMPPKGKLADEDIATLREWVRRGLPDPRDSQSPPPLREEIDIEAGRRFWAFQNPQPLPIPDVTDTKWPRNAIDHFILRRLESTALHPTKDAARTTLARRIFITLVGLPPTPIEVAQFVHDPVKDDQAITSLVDRLFASHHFGERWGRHWLDVARYAESSGGGRSLMFRNAWRFRDYAVRAMNEDKPFNQMIIEQIAGDLLPSESREQRIDQLVATGFLVLGPTNYEQQDKSLLRMEVIGEQVDTVGKAFLAMSLGCARCHDHKFDPIPTTDYYALAGIFGSTQSLVFGNVSSFVKTPLPPNEDQSQQDEAYQHELARMESQNTMLKSRLAALGCNDLVDPQANDDGQAEVVGKPIQSMPRSAQEDAEAKRLMEQWKRLQKQLATSRKSPPGQYRFAMSVVNVDRPTDGSLHIRGEVRNLGPTVPRGFLTVAMNASAPRPKFNDRESGRLALAKWIANDANPLTARVYVNRVWKHLFGRGIVATPDNHGTTGSRPSHPELLDHLAVQFMKDGWSTKRLIRRIMTSRVYRLSIEGDAESMAADPENLFLWRANRRPIDAEVLRDAMLAVAGNLDLQAEGSTITKHSPYDWGYDFSGFQRRSVYVPLFRNALLEFFDVFDVANPNLVTGSRNASTLPTQSLFLMNNPFVIQQSRLVATRLLAEDPGSEGELVTRLYRLLLNRSPSDAELEIALKYVAEFNAQGRSSDERIEGLSSLCHIVFACVDFRYLK